MRFIKQLSHTGRFFFCVIMKSKVCHYKELILHEFNSSSGTPVTPQGFLVKESVGATVVPEDEL